MALSHLTKGRNKKGEEATLRYLKQIKKISDEVNLKNLD
jgi:hypothetical protein